MTDDTTVRWDILGPANIATKAARAIDLASGAELTAIASRDLDRARYWPSSYNLPGHCPAVRSS